MHKDMFLLFRSRAVGNSKQNSKDIATFTKILDSLLDGYDNRLRPGLGGKMQTTEASIKSKQHRQKLDKFQVNMTPLCRKCTIHLFYTQFFCSTNGDKGITILS